MKTVIRLLITLLVIVVRTKVYSFNIEYRNPIVKRAPPNQSGSYFGFSVAQHAIEQNSNDPNDYCILVGAPLGNNLQPNTNHQGSQDDCEQIETDGKRLDDFDYDDVAPRSPVVLNPPGNDEIKNDQWLGVSVKSQKPGGKVVVCAHRYIQSPNLTLYHHGLGLCYLLQNRLEVEEELQPCKERPTDKLHQQFGYCQVGTSLAMLDDGFALMGSPGPYTWRGTIFAKSVVGSFLDRDKTVYMGPLNDKPTPIDKYSYLGMSVTGGRFFSKDTTTFVSGAPRSNFVGQVFFFEKTKSVEKLNIRLIINGTQFASSFGYELLAVDIDQDGYDELLVSAPFYYGNDKGGAVYVYDRLRNCTETACNYTRAWYGSHESRFGFAMTSVGDINKDGFTDVAIGAPYEKGGGAVYIYLGSNSGLQEKATQVIKHEEFGIKTLGYSLSGGLDMDLNDYPDLLVGAYESERVILYKTRPIIHIAITVDRRELKNINASRKGCMGNPGTNKTCFSFKTCFTLSKFKLTQPLDVKYEIKELHKKIPRVTFGEDSVTVDYIRVTDSRKNYCTEKVAYLAEGNGDILTPLKFQVNYTLHNDKIDSPILNKTSVETFEATFQKNCGNDDICKSRLILQAAPLLNKTEDGYILNLGEMKELIVDATVSNTGESAYEAKLFVEHPEGLSFVVLETDKNKTSHIICTSYNDTTIVTCNLGNPFLKSQKAHLRLRFEIGDTKQQELKLNVFVNSTSRELSKNTSVSFVAVLQKVAYYQIKGDGKPSNILYSGEVKGESAMRFFEDIGPRVVHTFSVINNGQWMIRDMTVIIRWPYEVAPKRGDSGKRLLYLERQPVIDFNTTNYCIAQPSDAVNPLGLSSTGIEEDLDADDSKEENTTLVRRKRDAYSVDPETITGQDGNQRKIVNMDCGRGAKCATITCTIPQLQHNEVKIKIYSRVWNSTLIEDYGKVDWVSINTTATVMFKDEAVIHSSNSVQNVTINLKAYPMVVGAKTGVNIWIIVGSVVAGLFLLFLVIFALYKCGFFKRNRIKDHTLSGNLKKQGESETLLKEREGKPPKRAL